MSFLEKEEDQQSNLWDWVVGIGLLVLIGGFFTYYQYQKKYSTARFHEADALFAQGKIVEAAVLYEELKTAQYLTSKHDSLIYARLDSVESLRESHSESIKDANTRLAAGDSEGARILLNKVPEPGLLPDHLQAAYDSLVKLLGPVSVTDPLKGTLPKGP